MSLSSSPAAAASGGDLLAGLLRLAASTRPSADTRLISSAYETAAYWHQGQKRKSGDPYITHPVAVAAILAEIGADDQTLRGLAARCRGGYAVHAGGLEGQVRRRDRGPCRGSHRTG